MSRKTLVAAMEKSGLQIAHMAWPDNSKPALPWMVYYLEDDGKISADNRRLKSIPRWCVELYEEYADSEVEERVEKAITDAFGDFDKTEVWLSDEDCLMTAYTFTEIERI